ncbi:T-cell surface glycoprotein CD3 epsilon chain-like [Melanotaenia boesemani]|uniref:T-cell surface glycoprotein CD3 epsilon chain-like n=1 Tax=Melanotaenia boesemani TaxID=1250792 RepID=UPI001C0559EC|nr:T-cell surface glycoprotein CD3 epsilon chain-like [Melanotaenia boesemani]
MEVQAVLVVLFMFASTVKTDAGGAVFWRNKVTLTCPGEGKWYDNEKEIHNGKTLQTEYKQPLKYRCDYSEDDIEKTYFFYVKGRACENCFELDASLFGLVIIVDVVGTAAVMMMIYRCTKKRSSDKLAHPSKPPLPPGSRRPAGPRGTYEELQPRSRATDTYTTLNRLQ